MQSYEGYYENGRFYVKGEPNRRIVPGKRCAIITILDDGEQKTIQPSKKPRSELMGIFEGKITISDDFDLPIEEMREYM